MERNIYKIGKELFVTNDEEIKEEDWCLFNKLEIVKCIYSKNGEYLFSNPLTSSSNHHFSYFRKIILTTDLDLIVDGVQKIDDEFLEWFCSNSSCEEVKVVDNLKYFNVDELRERHIKGLPQLYFEKIGYKTIIPKRRTNK